ncbi:MAG: peptidylprolyl isomerase [Bacillota bacterium]
MKNNLAYKSKRIFIISLVVIMGLCLVSCGINDEQGSTDTDAGSSQDEVSYCVEIGVSYDTDNSLTIKIELLPDYAPITVTNFLELVQSGHYDGTIMHRVIENACVQGGGYVYDEDYNWISAGSVDSIYGEFLANGDDNNLSHTAGAISMARSSAYDSASDQFFLCPNDVTGWDGYYAVFGYVMDEESLIAIQTLSRVPVDEENYEPISPVVIDYIKII